MQLCLPVIALRRPRGLALPRISRVARDQLVHRYPRNRGGEPGQMTELGRGGEVTYLLLVHHRNPSGDAQTRMVVTPSAARISRMYVTCTPSTTSGDAPTDSYKPPGIVSIVQ